MSMLSVLIPIALLFVIILCKKIPKIGGNIHAALVISGLAALLLAALLPVSASAAENPSMGASYTEIPDAIANPERGFYSTLYMAGKETGNTVQNPTGKLIHMRISLGNFSHN